MSSAPDTSRFSFTSFSSPMTSINTTNISSTLPPLAKDSLFLPRNQHGDNFLLAMIVINAVMAAVASCSNAVVIYTISRTPSLQTPSNILILGLAVSDFGIGVFVQPCLCVRLFAELEYNEKLYDESHFVYLPSSWTLAAVSVLTLTMVIADRFLAIHLHLRYQELVTVKRYVIVLPVIWLISPWFGVSSRTRNSNGTFYNVTIAGISILTTLNGYFILKIQQAIRRHSLQIHVNTPMGQDMPRQKKSVKIMYLVIGSFLLCYGPYWAVMVIRQTLEYTLTLRYCSEVAKALWMFNSVLNPIIYFWRIEEMRNAALVLLQKIRQCGHIN